MFQLLFSFGLCGFCLHQIVSSHLNSSSNATQLTIEKSTNLQGPSSSGQLPIISHKNVQQLQNEKSRNKRFALFWRRPNQPAPQPKPNPYLYGVILFSSSLLYLLTSHLPNFEHSNNNDTAESTLNSGITKSTSGLPAPPINAPAPATDSSSANSSNIYSCIFIPLSIFLFIILAILIVYYYRARRENIEAENAAQNRSSSPGISVLSVRQNTSPVEGAGSV